MTTSACSAVPQPIAPPGPEYIPGGEEAGVCNGHLPPLSAQVEDGWNCNFLLLYIFCIKRGVFIFIFTILQYLLIQVNMLSSLSYAFIKKAPQYNTICHHNQQQQQDISHLGLFLLYGRWSLHSVAKTKQIADKLNIESELRTTSRRKSGKGEKATIPLWTSQYISRKHRRKFLNQCFLKIHRARVFLPYLVRHIYIYI